MSHGLESYLDYRVTYHVSDLFGPEARPHSLNKQIVYDQAMQGPPPQGEVTVARWSPVPLATSFSADDEKELVARPDVYDYVPLHDGNQSNEWHVNFADPYLFVAWDSGLFAQDEIQAAEHPALGPIKMRLEREGREVLTVAVEDPYPILVSGVERRVTVRMDPNDEEGRPYGLYGNEFSQASASAVERATVRIEPPTQSNILAIAAPAGGYGSYREDEIRYVLSAAYTGYVAAKVESKHEDKVVIHTGYWGCGAFGGNRTLMTILQVMAARMADVAMVYHCFDQAGMDTYQEALRKMEKLLGTGEVVTEKAIQTLVEAQFPWGFSDGN